MAIFYRMVNEYGFSVPIERHTLLISHDFILHTSFLWHHKCHGTCDRDDHLKLERRRLEKDYFWTKSYHVTSVANNLTNLLIVDMSMLHDVSSWNSKTHLKEKIWFMPLKENLKFTSIDTGTKSYPGFMWWFYGYFYLFILDHVMFF